MLNDLFPGFLRQFYLTFPKEWTENYYLLVLLEAGVNAALQVAGGISVLGLIFGGVLELGLCQYLLKVYRGEDAGFSDLFGQFHRFLPGFCLKLFTTVLIFLGSLLLVIPGILMTYNYAMAPFILLENPGLGPIQAMKASRKFMKSLTGELFSLDLSFIGWQILSGLVGGMGQLLLFPYIHMSRAVFYLHYKDHPSE